MAAKDYRNKISRLLEALLLATAIALQPDTVLAQLGTVQWQKRYGQPQVEEVISSVCRTDSNTVALAGYSWPRSTPGVNTFARPMVLFANNQGDSLGSYIHQWPGYITNIFNHPYSGLTAVGGNLDSIFVMQLDTDGAALWKRGYFMGTLRSGMGKAIAVPDGYLIIRGRKLNASVNITKTLITKLDLEGRLVWERYYSLSNTDDIPIDITPTSDGSYTLLGTTWGKGVLTQTTYDANYFFLKLRPNGDSIRSGWTGMYNIKEKALAIRETKDGGFICTGTYLLPGQTERVQGHVLKVDSLWRKQWDVKILPGWGSTSAGCELTGVRELITGDFIVAGTNRPQFGVVDGYVARIRPGLPSPQATTFLHQNNASNKIFDTAFDADGSAIFAGSKSLTTSIDFYAARLTNLGQPYQLNYCVTPPNAHFSYRFSNDTLYLTDSSSTHLPYDVLSRWSWDFGGWTSHKEGQQLQPFYFPPSQQVRGNYLRLTVTNNLFCTDTLTFYPWGLPPVATPEQQHLQVQVYPNPAWEQVAFVLPQAGGAAQLQLYNGSGQLVRQQVLQPGQNRLSLQGLPQGLYLYHLQQGARQQRGKLVKQE